MNETIDVSTSKVRNEIYVDVTRMNDRRVYGGRKSESMDAIILRLISHGVRA
jgi:hypothetical protein